MTWAFEEPSTFVIRGTGSVTLEEWEKTVAGILTHERLTPGVRLLIDGRETERVPSTGDLRLGAALLPRLQEHGLTDVAIVAERSSVYGVARMVAVIVSHLGVSMRAFRRLDEAQAWLDAEEAVNRS